MVQEVCSLSQQLQDAEAQSVSAYDQRDSLQRTLVDMRARQQIHTSQLKTKVQGLERKNKALREKNEAARRRVAQLQQQVDSIVSESWREHIYAQQSSEWFKDFERKMLN
jgi:predicted  nucleic acid-binding Zn-ribbon protein